jgi:hypothetical protein
MILRYPKNIGPAGSREENNAAAPQESEHVHNDTCRCEETSKMTPRQLLGLMMTDLAFWKKTKKRQSAKD